MFEMLDQDLKPYFFNGGCNWLDHCATASCNETGPIYGLYQMYTLHV